MNGLAIVALAIIFDRVTQEYGQRIQKHRGQLKKVDQFVSSNFLDSISKSIKIRMNFSLEIGPKTDLETLPPLSDVYITMLPGGDYKETADKAARACKKRI